MAQTLITAEGRLTHSTCVHYSLQEQTGFRASVFLIYDTKVISRLRDLYDSLCYTAVELL